MAPQVSRNVMAVATLIAIPLHPNFQIHGEPQGLNNITLHIRLSQHTVRLGWQACEPTLCQKTIAIHMNVLNINMDFFLNLNLNIFFLRESICVLLEE